MPRFTHRHGGLLLFGAAGLLLALAAAPSAPGPAVAGLLPSENVDAAAPVIEVAPSGAGRANALAYSPDGRLLAVGTASGLAIYDALTQAEVRFIPSDTWVRAVAFSPDGQTLAAGYYEPVVRLWRISDGILIRELPGEAPGHTSWVRSLVFTPDGNTLLTACDDSVLRWWDVHAGRLVRKVTDGMTGLRVVAISPDGKILAAGGADGKVRLLRVADGALLHTLEGHTDWIRSLAFSPDGQTLASGAFDARVRLWRVSDGAPLHELSGHTFSVLGVAFSPDGQTLATGSVDANIVLWRVRDARQQYVLSGHTGFVFTVAFSPDGHTLASGAVDNTVRLWDVTPAALGEPLAEMPPKVPSTSCVECHHPAGDYLRPGGVTAAPPVVEVACAACHAGGTLVLHWCPAFPRAAGDNARHGTWANMSNQVGFPRAGRDFALAVAAPGNGEHYYVPAYHAALPISGQLLGDLADTVGAQVTLEIWSGGQRTATDSTVSGSDGRFHFSTDLRPQGIVLEVNPEERTCMICHGETLAGRPVVPAGDVRLVVQAVSRNGKVATDERWITVDRGQTATAAVSLVPEAPGTEPLPSLTVLAGTRLYGWRARGFTALTESATGQAEIQVETLTEVETIYRVEVPPTAVDGRLYSSVAPVTVTLPAGATEMPPITLSIRVEAGRITGRLAGAAGTAPLPAGLPVRAVRLPDGASFEAQTEPGGGFALAGLPIGTYRVAVEAAPLAALGLAASPERVTLSTGAAAEASLTVYPLSGSSRQGVVLDSSGQPLPFAWVTEGPAGAGRPVLPAGGAWALYGIAPGAHSLVASAPGHFSQAQALPEAGAAPLEFRLVAAPGLQRLAWGSGAVFVPPETVATLAAGQLALERGWVWGQGEGPAPLAITVGQLAMTFESARFAIEQPAGQTGWLYVLAGSARVAPVGQPEVGLVVPAGSMLALGPGPGTLPVPLDSAVIDTLRTGTTAPLGVSWQPTLAAQVRDRLALAGLTTAKALTLTTYGLSLALVAGLPAGFLVRWARKKK